jgi:hypothetical protein
MHIKVIASIIGGAVLASTLPSLATATVNTTRNKDAELSWLLRVQEVSKYRMTSEQNQALLEHPIYISALPAASLACQNEGAAHSLGKILGLKEKSIELIYSEYKRTFCSN